MTLRRVVQAPDSTQDDVVDNTADQHDACRSVDDRHGSAFPCWFRSQSRSPGLSRWQLGDNLVDLVLVLTHDLQPIISGEVPADSGLGQVGLTMHRTGHWTGIKLGYAHDDPRARRIAIPDIGRDRQ
jgi:hypothetical protein